MSRLNSNDEWAPCEQGSLRALAEQVRMRSEAKLRRRRMIASLAVTGSALLLVSSYVVLRPEGEANFGGITCSHVRDALAAFVDGTLDEPTAKRVELHLAKCDQCAAAHSEMTGVAERVTPSRGVDEFAEVRRDRGDSRVVSFAILQRP